MSGQLWPCASWCTDKAEPGHETCAYRPGDRSKPTTISLLRDRLKFMDEPQRPPWLHVVARDEAGPVAYNSAVLEIGVASELMPVFRRLGHGYLADAIHSALLTAGAVLTEKYGLQRWEIPDE